ncbi:MAG: hypothetical protein AABZ60_15165 [Planctomycetota bacterium]
MLEIPGQLFFSILFYKLARELQAVVPTKSFRQILQFQLLEAMIWSQF